MRLRNAPGLFALALLGLPACLDPIVGGECKPGFSPCHGVCLPAGACQMIDASSSEANPVAIDGPGSGVDGDGLDGDDLDGGDIDGGGKAPVDAAAADRPASETRKDADANVTRPEVADTVVRRDVIGPSDVVDASVPYEVPPDVPPVSDAPPASDAPAPVFTDASSDGDIDGDDRDGNDAQDDGGSDDAEATIDVSPEPDGPLLCSEAQIVCNGGCVDPANDPENCGDCNTICATGVCIEGDCLVCESDESVCGRQCINLATDPDNCGGCGIPCASGLCSNGKCEAAGTGRAIVIGHDYYKNRPAMNRILGNAVFLWPTNPVRLLAYVGDADPIAVNGANSAIEQVATATGRQPVVTVTSSAAEVPTGLASADVLLVYGQAQADDDKLARIGQSWASALTVFVQSGGTVIVLDAVYAANQGTVQILSQAGLFDIARATSSTGNVCTVVARGDALASGLLRTYLCETNSTTFSIADTATTITSVVGDGTGTVVVHKVF